MTPPPGIPDLHAVTENAPDNALVTLPAVWLLELIEYVRWPESQAEPDAPQSG